MMTRKAFRVGYDRPSFTPSFHHLSRVVLALACMLLALGCSRRESSEQNVQPGATGEVSLNGAGATFPYPLYSKWMAEYNKLHPNVRINYQSIGSGGGIRQIVAGTVDFGATDTAMTQSEVQKAPGQLNHVPTTVGAVVVAYNVGDLKGLKLSGDVLADIFLGKITKWNDPRIAADNPGASLPDQSISVVHRSDGSGTSAIFTEYLAAVSPEWKDKVGVGKSVRWPTGLGAKGNEGVTGQVKTTPGAIGYTETAYAQQNQLAVAAIKNRAGEFVEPKTEAISKAAETAQLSEDLHASLVDAEGAGVYPIAAYTYLLVYQEARDPAKGEALAKFLWWAIHDGQKYAAELHYAPLPANVTEKIETRLRNLKYEGKPLLSGV